MTAAPMMTTTTTMTPAAKYPNCLSRRQNVRRYCPIERGDNVLAGEIPSYRVRGRGHRVVVVGVLPDAALDQRLCGHGAEPAR
jgi:hypothetical protein